MIRVLQVVNDMHRAGLETMLMNYYRNIDRTKIQFDFLTHRAEKSDYDDEILSLGGKVYYAPRLYPHNYPKYFKYMEEFFLKHPEYKIVHSHIDTMSYLPLLAAKKANIPVRIAHSHNTAIDKDFKYILKQYFRSKIMNVANYYCACGNEAGKFLFPNKEFTFIPNAIEKHRFIFNETVRENKRRELGIKDEFVIGHVGRLSYQKNHKFLIEIFDKIHKINKNTVLLLIGVGEKEEEIRKHIEMLSLTEYVKFLGNRSDVDQLYQAMDVFVMPSLFEGIPVVGIEAQFSGLPCFFSNKVPNEVKFSNNVEFIDLFTNAEKWASSIININKEDRYITNLTQNIYDIRNSVKILEEYYQSFMY